MRYMIDLPSAPAVGAQLVIRNHRGRHHRLTLMRVDDPWRPCDVVLHWRDDAGQRYTSGLRSRTLHVVTP